MIGTVVEVGPAAVVRLTPNPATVGDREMVAAALAGIDDTVVLVGERPVAVADLWRRVIAASVDHPCESLTVIHPPWWTPQRVRRVTEAATTVAGNVRTQPKSAAFDAGDAGSVIDAAAAVPGSVRCGDRTPPVGVDGQSRRWPPRVLVAAAVAVTLCCVGLAAARTRGPAPSPDAINIVEGRITVRVPAHWVVSRVTAGPGSRRVQASSPTEPNVALHITQSYSPGQTLADAAAVLSPALDRQPHGVFVDFNATDHRAGRAALTYREIRIGREVGWTVIVDGATRISIGCQSGAGRQGTVAEACDQAIKSAHELSGTGTGARASN